MNIEEADKLIYDFKFQNRRLIEIQDAMLKAESGILTVMVVGSSDMYFYANQYEDEILYFLDSLNKAVTLEIEEIKIKLRKVGINA